MARRGNHSPASPGEEEPVSYWQVFMDDIFLLLTLGLSVPFLFYLLWGLWDLVRVPTFQP